MLRQIRVQSMAVGSLLLIASAGCGASANTTAVSDRISTFAGDFLRELLAALLL